MAEERNTIIGESITVKGEISGDQDLILHGRVEGEINLSKNLLIKPPSETNAHVKAKNVTVSGRLEGNIEAGEKVELSAEGKMVGDIHSPRIVIVDGAYFKGSIDMGDEGSRPKPEPTKAAAKDKEKAEANPGSGDESGEDGDQSGGKDRKMVMPDYLLGKKK